MINNMKTILSAVKQYVDGGLKRSVPDWNESNPDSINYVKNKTHYEEKKKRNFHTQAFTSCWQDFYEGSVQISLDNTYKVIFNGVTYECVPYELMYWWDNGGIAIGCNNLSGDTEDLGYNEPFLFYYDNNGGYCCLLFKELKTHTISLYSVSNGVETAIFENEIFDLSGSLAWDEESLADKFAVTSPNKKYTVTVNNETYELISKGDEYECWIGGDNNVPFVIATEIYEGRVEWTGFASIEAGYYDISIDYFDTIIHKIDSKYLPEMSSVGKEGEGSHAEIFNDYIYNQASGDYAHAEGSEVTASGLYSHAEGLNTNATGWYSHAEGRFATASGENTHAEGYNTTASGNYSHAEGYRTKATTTDDSVSTSSSTTKGYCAHAEGYGTVAYGAISHAEGNGTKASGVNSHSEGYNTTASGNYSHAEGCNTTTSGLYSHAEGYRTKASGTSSHAEGYNTTASGNYSHAEGNGTKASGISSHAEGYNTTASDNYSHAEGWSTTASGEYSHAEGYYTTAQRKSQHAQGEYNILDTEGTASSRGKYAHIVGNGTSDTKRSNAHTLDWKGNAWFAGDIYVGGTGQDDDAAKKVTTTENTLTIIEEDFDPPLVAPIAYGDGIFASHQEYSYDGITWFNNGASPANIKAATYGNGVFVLICGDGASTYNSAYYSTDGINWKSTTLPYSSYWRSVAYGNGKFVAVSQNKAAYSTDGVTWTGISVPSGAAGNQYIAYGNNKFVLVGGLNGAYSEDGITWNTVEGLSGYKVVYGNGLFIVARSGNSNAGSYMYSADGINWTVVSGEIIRPQCLSYANGIFIGSHDVRSVDGITWTNYSLPSGLAEEIIDVNGNIIAPGNKIFIARTNHAGIPKAYSYDGINWFTTCSATLIQNDVDVVGEVRDILDVVTKTEIDTYELITVADIDEICGTMQSL